MSAKLPDWGTTMIVTDHYEPTIGGMIITLCGKDSAGNSLGQEIELLVITKHKPANVALSVEALVALLRQVDDFKVVSVPESQADFHDKWAIMPNGQNGNGHNSNGQSPLRREVRVNGQTN